jgi:hypothetical protein
MSADTRPPEDVMDVWQQRFDAHVSGVESPPADAVARVRRNVREGWSLMSTADLLVVAAALGALARETVKVPGPRGTADRPCEWCGNATTNSTVCHRGFYRCNTCGEPSQ